MVAGAPHFDPPLVGQLGCKHPTSPPPPPSATTLTRTSCPISRIMDISQSCTWGCADGPSWCMGGGVRLVSGMLFRQWGAIAHALSYNPAVQRTSNIR